MAQFKADVDKLTTCDSGTRPLSSIRFIAFHTYECPRGDDVEGRAAWQEQSKTGSYTLLIGTQRTLRANDDNYIPWAARATGNRYGIHYSFLGYARESRDVWLAHMHQLELAARAAAHDCKEYELPLKWLTPAELRAGHKGLCTHADISAAWHESDHTDPGAGFPKDVMLQLIRRHMNNSAAPTVTKKKEDSTLSNLAEKRIELALDQLAGAQKNSDGTPTFEGWSIADVIRVFDQRDGDTATLMQVACLNNRELHRLNEGVAKLSDGIVTLCDALKEKKESEVA